MISNNERSRILNLVKNLKTTIYDNIEINGSFYCVKPFTFSTEGFDGIKLLYGDYLINSMFISQNEMSDESYWNRLKFICETSEQDGISIWNIIDKSNNSSVGLFGLTYLDNYSKIEINFGTRIKNIIPQICEIFTPFVFEYLKLDCLYGKTISYNYPSQHILKVIGMEECGTLDCSDDYKKDSYLTLFKITRKKYEDIKKENNGRYRLKSSRKDFNNPQKLHSKARTLSAAVQWFKKESQTERYNHCARLLSYLEMRYPIIYRKN